MFENVIVHRSGDRHTLVDPGVVAECLLFYQNVHLVLDSGHLSELVKHIGIDNLYRLLDSGFATAAFVQDHLGVRSGNHGGLLIYDFAVAILHSHGVGKRRLTREDRIRDALKIALNDDALAKRWTKKLLPKIAFRKLLTDFSSEQLAELAVNDVQDHAYTRTAVLTILRQLVPMYRAPPEAYFYVYNSPRGLMVATDLNFDAINREYHKIVPPTHSSITPAYILSHLLDARADIALAAHYGGDVVTTPESAQIMTLKFADILRRRSKNLEQIELFQDALLANARALREAINDGARNFGELIDLLEDARKFKEWLKGTPPDAVLLQEYYDAVMKDTWLDKLGGKAARFVFFTAAGIVADILAPTGYGTASGVAVGLTDTFVVDQIVRGWRPNQFVEDDLKPFVADQ